MSASSVTWNGRRWRGRDSLALAALVGLALAATWPAWVDMLRFATQDGRQSHILFAVPVAAWLGWLRRGRLRRRLRRGKGAALALLVLGVVLHAAGPRWDVLILWHGGALLIVVAAALLVSGTTIVRQALPAFLALGFVVPVPRSAWVAISERMQVVIADGAQRALDLVGVEVSRVGNALQVEGGELVIADGPRMLFAFCLVSYAFAFSMPIRAVARGVILLMSPLTAVACNIAWLAPAVAAYAASSPELARTLSRVGSWAMIPIAFAAMYGLVHLLRWAYVPVHRYTLAYGK